MFEQYSSTKFMVFTQLSKILINNLFYINNHNLSI